MTRRRLFLFNPNTTQAITDRLIAAMAPMLAKDIDLHASTAAFGSPYITDEVSFAVGAHAAVVWMQNLQRATDLDPHQDRVLIGCFGDPGLHALRSLCPCRVDGLAEAAMRQAASLGSYAIVTGGKAWAPMLWRLARSAQLDAGLVAIDTLDATGAQLAADPQWAVQTLTEQCLALIERQRREAPLNAIILGGAGLAGYAAAIRPALDCPLIDSVEAGCLGAPR